MTTTLPSNIKKWFLIFAVLYASANLIAAIKIDFESSIFLPFRYEGLLFFENALLSDTNAFFFIRDWSTSFLPEEHPLLYFHNLDLIHLFAGFVQYLSSHGKIILFTLSLLISLLGLWMIARDFNKHIGTLFTVLFIALLVISVGAFRLSPQNLFITLAIFSVIWNLILLRRIWHYETLDLKFFLELFSMFLLVAAVETNLAVMLVIITGFFALFSTKTLFKFSSIKRIFLIGFISALPIVLFRLIQLASIYYYGYLNEYMTDISYTSQLKVHSNVDTLDAIAFYAQHGLTFFGQGAPQKIVTNVINLTRYYWDFYGNLLWFSMLLFCLLILLRKKQINQFIGHKKSVQFQNVTFLSSYLLFFTIASYLLLFLSGDAVIKVFLSKFAIIDIAVVYRTFFILLIPLILYTLVDSKKTIFAYLALVALLFFAYFARHLILETRLEYFGYKEIVSLIPENSNIISNFEPSVLAIETKSRVNMSWFEKQPYSCSLLNSKNLLKMYKVNNNEYNENSYLFLVHYPPYSTGGKKALVDRHCIQHQTHQLLYEDDLYLLYKVNYRFSN